MTTTVALFADRNVIAPTHVALASMLAHWPNSSPLSVRVFQSGWTSEDMDALHATVARWADRADLRIQAIDLDRISRWKCLYGSRMPYGRLFLPKLLPDVREVLYMDVDAVVEIDVSQVVDAGALTGPVAAMQAWDFAHSHDEALAVDCGIDPQATYFHSGMLVLDLEWLRRSAALERFLAFGDAHASRLNSHDQTILNIVLRGDITAIPAQYTGHLYPTNRIAPTRRPAVQSFCGSPKPFDPMGNWLNAHSELFNDWLSRTALSGWSPNQPRELLRVRRNLRLLRPMVGTAMRMLGLRRDAA